MTKYDREEDLAPLEDDDRFTLGDLTRLTRRYRPVVRLSMLAVAVALVIAANVGYLLLPAARTSNLNFRLAFRGADVGQYPNGTPFSATEIISPVVLAQVYRQNGLESFVPFSDFKSSLYVIQRNDELEALTSQYRAKLSDPRLSSVDRARIEQEFREKKESLDKAGFSLVLVTHERLRLLPFATREKLLNDVLSTWAEQTVDDKGVLLYDISILSSGLLADIGKTPDYLITLDLLRTKIYQIQLNIDQLLSLPGAKVLRARSSKRSLAEIRAGLNDMATYRIQPLIGALAQNGISRQPVHSEEFLRTAITFSDLRVSEAKARVDALRDSIDRYAQQEQRATTEMPQSASGMPMDASFLDRILALSAEDTDLRFRQELVDDYRAEALKVVPLEAESRYYRDLQALFRSRRAPTDAEAKWFDAEIQAIVGDARRVTDEVYEIYTALSEDLNPSTALFAINEPITHAVERPVAVTSFALLGLLVLFASFPIIVLGCAIHARFFAGNAGEEPAIQRKPAETSATAATPIDEPVT